MPSTRRERLKRKLKTRAKKFAAWLHSKKDHRDDDWVVIWAKTKQEAALKEIYYNRERFTLGPILTAAEFRRSTGVPA
jgi:hypothetical protein